MRFFSAPFACMAVLFATLQNPQFAAGHCFEAREVAPGNVQALKAEPYGRRSFIHCGSGGHHDDGGYHGGDDGDYGHGGHDGGYAKRGEPTKSGDAEKDDDDENYW